MPFTIVGRTEGDEGARPFAEFQMITPDYVETFGIRPLRGRRFTDQDSAGTARVALINERFVDSFLKGLDPLRQRLLIEDLTPGVQKLGPPVEWQIVGVVSDVNNGGPFGERAAPHIYHRRKPTPDGRLPDCEPHVLSDPRSAHPCRPGLRQPRRATALLSAS